MSRTQLVGGALAAMTAAALGSQLGVAGTLLGAAIASIVAGAAARSTRRRCNTPRTSSPPRSSAGSARPPSELDHRRRRHRAVGGWTTVTQPPAAVVALARPGGHRRRVDPADAPSGGLEADPGQPVAVFLLADRRHHRLRADLRPVRLRRRGHHHHAGQRGPPGRYGHAHARPPASGTSTEPSTEPSVAPSTGTSAEPSSVPSSRRAHGRAEPDRGAVRQRRAEHTASPSTDPQVGGADPRHEPRLTARAAPSGGRPGPSQRSAARLQRRRRRAVVPR